MSHRRILITGSTGGVGSILTQRLKDEYDVTGHDRTTRPDADPVVLGADLADYDAVRSLMDGIDTVVHLAGAASPESPWEAVLDANIIGTRNVLEAARDAGVQRVVYASSNHTMGMYDRYEQWPVYPDTPPRPDSFYGVSKVFGETLGRYYHDEYGLSVIALRIGWVAQDPTITGVDVLHAMWLSEADTAQVVRCAIEADVDFGIYYAISDNPNRRWSMTNTNLELGYRPRDSWADFAPEGEPVVTGGVDVPDSWPKGS
ncbi:NAD-dependent epimerase/dehydratase family protein [Janibacter cremeus]|uniref:dTDP-4-dehydrorhamnose reductase n=1 Tax=Janibacter cremeus TaxID=1285192 RepID=A0A852VSS7_9MICO|nr:NAD(P)-dependent oxidoreductase [Janibacter cremeus]NYF96875.1 dTDP-4-dehydrorhamnose reductase [Janibacter cremeus]